MNNEQAMQMVNTLLDMVFNEDIERTFIHCVPEDVSWLRLNHVQIMEVYYLTEVLWNKGGWLQERPSNVRRGRAKGFVGESTDIQIRRVVRRLFDSGKLSHLPYTYAEKHFLSLTWERLSTHQKILYFALLKRWGLCGETIHSV